MLSVLERPSSFAIIIFLLQAGLAVEPVDQVRMNIALPGVRGGALHIVSCRNNINCGRGCMLAAHSVTHLDCSPTCISREKDITHF